MHREYHRWFSRSLQRDMDLLVFGHGGPPVVVFPTSQGAFFEYEDRGMVSALSSKLDHGQLRLFCVSSVDSESWYNRRIHPRHRVQFRRLSRDGDRAAPPLCLHVVHDDRQYRRNKWVLVTGDADICRGDNEQFSGLLHAKGIPHSLHVWNHSKHDWPDWRPMAQAYLP